MAVINVQGALLMPSKKYSTGELMNQNSYQVHRLRSLYLILWRWLCFLLIFIA